MDNGSSGANHAAPGFGALARFRLRRARHGTTGGDPGRWKQCRSSVLRSASLIQSEDGVSQTRLKAADRECPGRGTSVR